MNDNLAQSINASDLPAKINNLYPTAGAKSNTVGRIKCVWRGGENHSGAIYKNQHGCWRIHDHVTGDDLNAFGFLTEIVGMTKRDAALELLRDAGLEHSPHVQTVRPEIREPTATERAESATSKFKPLTPQELERANRLTRPVQPTDHAALEIKRRGLSSAQVVFKVLKNDFVTHGRTIALAGGLVFFATNRDGEVWAVKCRNPGTEDELKAQGIARYAYLIAGHGSPPWCSQDDGSSNTAVLVEGEMNAMVLAPTIGSRFAVQGVAGAGAVPYLGSLKGRHALLYADDDQAGRDATHRWGLLALEAGAKSVRVLEPLVYPNDFCDRHADLGIWWPAALENAKTFAPPLAPPKNDPSKNAVQYTNPLHHTKRPLSGGAMVQAYNPLAKFHKKLALLTRGAR